MSAAAPVEPSVPAIAIRNLSFSYSAGGTTILEHVSLDIAKGSRVLLVGDNGAGKSTLMRIIAGRHIHKDDAVMVLGRNAFYDTSLNNHRAYLAGDWGRRTVAFTGHGCALQADIAVREMMADAQASFAARRDMLVSLLGIDLDWRMHHLSDGQRRRVQIMLQLLRPSSVLLLDEITTDLDLITRQDFLDYLKRDSEENGTTIVYATHIFDGLDDWATHYAHLGDKRILRTGKLLEDADFTGARTRGDPAPLLRTVERWFRSHRDMRLKRGEVVVEAAERAVDELRGELGNGYLPGRFNQGFN